MTFPEVIAEQARALTQSPPELIAVIAAIAYLVLAIRQNIWCWLFAAVSTSIYVWLFVIAKLYMESVLNLFYLVMAGYGWYSWTTGRSGDEDKPVVVWSFNVHAKAIAGVTALSLLTGWLLSRTDAAFPYVDSATTGFAIWATYLVARKVLENWWYWLAIDVVSIFIYWSRDLQLTGVLFCLYVAMIPFGMIAWKRSYLEQQG